MTNHLLYRYPTTATLSPGEGNGRTYVRFRTLTSLFSGAGRYTPAQVAERHAAVRFTNPDTPVRTLWYALYDTEHCTMNVSFYLSDSDHGEIRTPSWPSRSSRHQQPHHRPMPPPPAKSNRGGHHLRNPLDHDR